MRQEPRQTLIGQQGASYLESVRVVASYRDEDVELILGLDTLRRYIEDNSLPWELQQTTSA